jgi:hypothetical protein
MISPEVAQIGSAEAGVGPSSPGTPSASVCMRLLLFVPCLAPPTARQNLPDSPRTVSNALSFPPISSSFSDPICLAVGKSQGGRVSKATSSLSRPHRLGVWPRNGLRLGQAGHLHTPLQPRRWHSVRLWPKWFTETRRPPRVFACDEIDTYGILVTGQDTQALQIARGNEGTGDLPGRQAC